MFSFVGFFSFFLTLALQSADFSLCVWRRRLVERSITFEEWRYGGKKILAQKVQATQATKIPMVIEKANSQ